MLFDGPVVHGDMLCKVALVVWSFVRLPVGKNSSAKFLSSLLVFYGSFCLKGSSFRCILGVTGTRVSVARALTQQEEGVACYSTVLDASCFTQV
jgi:hypothetical protein